MPVLFLSKVRFKDNCAAPAGLSFAGWNPLEVMMEESRLLHKEIFGISDTC